MTARRTTRWPEARERAFVRAWNDDVERAILCERFGVKHPDHIARRLRARGYALVSRQDQRLGFARPPRRRAS